MTAGEWITLAIAIMAFIGGVWSAAKWVIDRLDSRFAESRERQDEVRDLILGRVKRVEDDTEELKAITSDLKADFRALKATCKVIHGLPDSTDPSNPPHVSQLRRGVA